MKFGRTTLVALTLASLRALPASAQEPEPDTLRSDQEAVLVRGEVADLTTQRPLLAASIRFLDLEDEGRLAWEGLSDSTGVFVGPRMAASTYRIEIDALGFRTATHVISLSGYGTADLRVELSPAALELEPLVVVSRRRTRLETVGFYDRRTAGFGYAFDRDQIEARNAMFVTDLVRAIPGVTVSPGAIGTGGILRMRGGCIPDVILDGVRLGPPVRLDDILSIEDLEGLEVYSAATTPLGYSRSTCGAVMAWTREPGADGGRPFSWKRAGAAAGFLLLGILLTG